MQRSSRTGLIAAVLFLGVAGAVWSGAFRAVFTAPMTPMAAEALRRDALRRREEKEDALRGDLSSLGSRLDEDDGKAIRKTPARPIVWPRAVAANR